MNYKQLIQIEIKKIGPRNFFKRVLLANFGIVLVVLMTTLTVSFSDGQMIPQIMTVSVIDTLVKSVFTVWQSVLIAILIVEEFRSKTVLVLFSYPIKRQMILLSKLLLIFALISSAMIFSQILQNGLFWWLSQLIPFIKYQISALEILQISMTTITAIAMGMAPLYIGMLNKSTVATVVSSIAIVSITVSSGLSDGTRMINILPISILLGLSGILTAYISIKKILKEDIVL
ncbi:hypothetical protein JOC70_002358 [Clostridium pascui]|uniref:ABC transporter permease n=1 Tax=Clostridium pascui TaxID=46609 RepID=UPI00195B6A0B|nr:ABC transporter permease [Clostridium pascui]MBM7870864.1 hypothetical protein [Clostridium pascui]